MSELRVVAERATGAPAEVVYRCIADFDRHHRRFLPPAFSEFRVEEGGVGAGTVHSFTMTAGGLFQRLFAPRVLRRIYADELERLDRYARTVPPG